MDELDELRAPPPRPPSRWAAFFSALACASVNVASPERDSEAADEDTATRHEAASKRKSEEAEAALTKATARRDADGAEKDADHTAIGHEFMRAMAKVKALKADAAAESDEAARLRAHASAARAVVAAAEACLVDVYERVDRVMQSAANDGHLDVVQQQLPEVREFDRARAHPRIQFSEDATRVWSTDKWATVLLAHPGVRVGRLTWHIRLDHTDHGAGAAVGVVDATAFSCATHGLGASPGSWCYSKTGKKGDGTGFREYGRRFRSGDTISVALDMDAETLAFSINGESQGVAFTKENGIGSCVLVPALCLGSTEGGKLARASLVVPAEPARRFAVAASNPTLTFDSAGGAVETRGEWGTALVEGPRVRGGGKFAFAVQLASAGEGCGAGVGFAVEPDFDARTRSLGAFAGSFCYSKTGQFSAGGAIAPWAPYGRALKTGDVVTAEVDGDADELRFYVNGADQGARRIDGLSRLCLRPAVALGSSEGGAYTRLVLAPPAVVRFDPTRRNRHVELLDADKRVFTDSQWCTALAAHPGVTSGGVLRFAVRLDGEGGAAVGFVDAHAFKVYSQNLGASPGTWALSKTGKVSRGDAWRDFSETLGSGDVIGAEANLVDGVIRYWKNGVLLGAAFSGLLDGSGSPEEAPHPPRELTLVPAVCLGSNKGGKASSAHLVEFSPAWLM